MTKKWGRKWKSMFRYSAYWHCWSRVLYRRGDRMVELNLTPIKGGSWEDRVAGARIRKHSTPVGRRDLLVEELPWEVLSLMNEHLGSERTNWLLTYDFLPRIDWVKHQKHNNAGCNFGLCRIESF